MAAKKDTQVPQEAARATPDEDGMEAAGLDSSAENAILRAQNETLMRRLERMEKLLAGTASPSPAELASQPVDPDNPPVFNEEAPFGQVWGSTEVAFVQNGHQFGHDKAYLRTEPNRGVPRPFNPRLVGFVRRPKPLELPA